MRLWVVVALVGCGRFGFDSLSVTDGSSSDGNLDTPIQTADTPVGQACTIDDECGRCARCTMGSSVCAIEPVTGFSLGHRSSCYLGLDGTRWCYGENTDGQLGLGDFENRATPVRADAHWSKIWMFYYGPSYGIRDGQLYTWGPSQTTSPVLAADQHTGLLDILGDTDPECFFLNDGHASCDPSNSVWLDVAAGRKHRCGVSSDGRLFCWGMSFDGALGANLADGVSQASPLQVGAATNWVEVGVGSNLDHYFSCARNSAMEVYCWGWQTYTGTNNVNVGATPTKILDGAMSLVVDWERGCSMMAGGKIRCWGKDTYGGYVLPGMGDVAVPTEMPGTWDAFELGGHHMCASASGQWSCFGWNNVGQLGNGTTVTDGVLDGFCP